jgi:hypothetical protein
MRYLAGVAPQSRDVHAAERSATATDAFSWMSPLPPSRAQDGANQATLWLISSLRPRLVVHPMLPKTAPELVLRGPGSDADPHHVVPRVQYREHAAPAGATSMSSPRQPRIDRIVVPPRHLMSSRSYSVLNCFFRSGAMELLVNYLAYPSQPEAFDDSYSSDRKSRSPGQTRGAPTRPSIRILPVQA